MRSFNAGGPKPSWTKIAIATIVALITLFLFAVIATEVMAIPAEQWEQAARRRRGPPVGWQAPLFVLVGAVVIKLLTYWRD